MPVKPELRALDIDVPAPPEAMVKLALLMAEQEVDFLRVAALIESDMALASAVMRAVNSSLYGLRERVQSVQQAITYLGTSEVAAITFEFGLRAVFPPAPELEPIWQRAARRGLLMSRMAQALGADAWGAHSAGLFEECGKAVLLRHARDHYAAMLRFSRNDAQLCEWEHLGFGVSHDALGAAMCENWGIGAAAVVCVRQHVVAQRDSQLPHQLARRDILALSVVCHILMNDPDALGAAAPRIAAQAGLDAAWLLQSARRLLEQPAAAVWHGR